MYQNALSFDKTYQIPFDIENACIQKKETGCGNSALKNFNRVFSLLFHCWKKALKELTKGKENNEDFRFTFSVIIQTFEE